MTFTHSMQDPKGLGNPICLNKCCHVSAIHMLQLMFQSYIQPYSTFQFSNLYVWAMLC